jgi:hypothetical protein
LGVGNEADLTPYKADVEKISEIASGRIDMINRRQFGYKEKDLTFDTWKIQTLFKTGGLISLLSQVKPRTTGVHHL